MSKSKLNSSIPTLSSLQTVVTFIATLFSGKFGSPSITDLFALTLCLVAIIIWKLRSAATANMWLQVAILIAFIPTFLSSYRQPSSELPICWLLWMISFIFQSAAVAMRMKKWQELAYSTTAIFWHGIVWIFTILPRH